MSLSLVATKFFAPPKRENSIERPGLQARLEAASNKSVTLVIAPAGYGKSCLVSEWLTTKKARSTWLGLHEEDSDLYRFTELVIEAIQIVEPDFGQHILYSLASPTPPSHQAINEAVCSELSQHIEDLYIVLDDFHLASSERVCGLLNSLLSLRIRGLHLVIISREEPQLSLARLRSEGQVAELRQDDLKLNPIEIATLSSRYLDLDQRDLQTITQKTEGWLAGLHLAFISLVSSKNPQSFIKSFGGNHTHVADYLLEEVLDRQTDEVKQFLISTSILQSFNASLCNAVVANTRSAEIIDYLEASNLFMIRLDDQREFYRYHHLFRDLLRQRLTDSTFANMLYDRAIGWYLSKGLDFEAFDLARQEGQIGRIISIIEGQGMPFYFRGLGRLVIAWAETLTKVESDQNPSVYLAHAWSLMMAGRPSLVEPRLKAFEIASSLEGFEPRGDAAGQVLALRALVAAAQRRIESIIPQALESLTLLDPSNVSVRTSVSLTLAAVYQFMGQDDESKRLFGEVIETGVASGNIMFSVAASVSLGQYLEREYKFFEAERIYLKAFEIITDPDHMVGCEVHLGLSRIYLEWGDFALAQRHLDFGERLAASLECEIQLSASLIRGKVYRAQGNSKAAIHVLDQAITTALAFKFDHMVAGFLNFKVRCLIDIGELLQAQGLAVQYQLAESRVRVLIAQGAYQDALLLTKREAASDRVSTLFLEAQALMGLKKLEEACDVIEKVFALTQTGEFFQSFVAEGDLIAHILTELRKKGRHQTEVNKILGSGSIKPQAEGHGLIEPLSEREIEVLELISKGLSNQEVSDRLFISLSTVKWHNQKVFEKLQVQRRTEAIVRARELRIIP